MATGKDAGGRQNKSTPQKSMFEGSGNPGGSRARRGPSHLKGTQSLERLRDRIDLAARELYRLREENAELHKELATIRSQGVEPSEGTAVVFAEGPSILRSKVKSCIEAIDRYILDSESESEAGSSSGPDKGLLTLPESAL